MTASHGMVQHSLDTVNPLNAHLDHSVRCDCWVLEFTKLLLTEESLATTSADDKACFSRMSVKVVLSQNGTDFVTNSI